MNQHQPTCRPDLELRQGLTFYFHMLALTWSYIRVLRSTSTCLALLRVPHALPCCVR